MAIAGNSGVGWLLPPIETLLRHGEHQFTTRVTNGRVEVDRRVNMKVILATRYMLARDWFE
jgi:hypothetical protein